MIISILLSHSDWMELETGMIIRAKQRHVNNKLTKTVCTMLQNITQSFLVPKRVRWKVRKPKI